jgi:macrolide-specific efflux system membrane fusion protein
VVSYSVTVALDTDPAKSLPGMSAQVAITIDEADNVVAVPAIALEGTNGNYAVRVLNSDGSVTVTPVQVGLVTSSLAQIMSGISDGQAVVTGTTSSLNSTSGGTTGFPAGRRRPHGDQRQLDLTPGRHDEQRRRHARHQPRIRNRPPPGRRPARC